LNKKEYEKKDYSPRGLMRVFISSTKLSFALEEKLMQKRSTYGTDQF
jgi:hypothetical protein